jgi:uncharacterized protein YlzI (FlbEa/FlbD family)
MDKLEGLDPHDRRLFGSILYYAKSKHLEEIESDDIYYGLDNAFDELKDLYDNEELVEMMEGYIEQIYNDEYNPDKTIEVSNGGKVVYKNPDVTHIGSGKYKINHEGETYEIDGKILRKFAKDLEKAGSSFSEWFGEVSKQRPVSYIISLLTINSPEDVLRGSFFWSNSSQGREYWLNISNKLKGIDV